MGGKTRGEALCLAHVVGRYDEPGLPEGYDEGRALYIHDRRLQAPKNPNIRVQFSSDPRTEGLRSNLLWALRSWRQLKGLLRGPGARVDAFASRCPYFREAMTDPGTYVRQSAEMIELQRHKDSGVAYSHNVSSRPRPSPGPKPPGLKTVVVSNLLLLTWLLTASV